LFPLVIAADNKADDMASLREGPYIGQHHPCSLFQKGGHSNAAYSVAVMNSLEPLGIGLRPSRRWCEISRIRPTKKRYPSPSALRLVTASTVPDKYGLATRHIATLDSEFSFSLHHNAEQKPAHKPDPW